MNLLKSILLASVLTAPFLLPAHAGKKGEIVWTFNRAGEFDFACLIPGHYQAGMVGTIRVSASKVAAK